ncbi:MAG TPA: ATP-binding protein [Methylomirabilota bacterium]
MSAEQESQAIVAAALDGVIVVDDSRTFVDANPAACRLLGLPRQELLGRRFDQFLEPGIDLDGAWQTFLRTGEQSNEVRVIRPDGVVMEIEYNATARFVAGRHLAILRDAAPRKQRETTRLRETETLLAVSRALSATLDPTETMRRVAREIAHAIGADMVGAYLADAAQEHLAPVAGYHVPPEMIETFRRIPIPIKNHRAIEEAWAQRRAVWTNDMASDPRVDRASYERFPHQSDLFVPIRIKDRPVGGFFVIWWRERRSFTDDEVRLVQGISDLAGIFLDNAQLYRAAAEANRAKDEFLATLSHELRNPLGAISTAVSVLERRGPHDESEGRLHQIISRQTKHLARLVDDLLDVARTSVGKITLNRQPLDLAEIAAISLRSLQDSGKTRAHRLTFRAESITVNADSTRLAQIVTNMLENALKFTPAGGSVDVDVAREGEDAILRVTDSGVGIAPETLSRVFELFAQGQQPLDRSAGGLGIGLSLSRRLVEMHGGTIAAASEGVGRGAQFTVRLPVETEKVSQMASAPAGPDPSRRVLIIEDNDDAREALRLLLESLGHQVTEADDGMHGLALALNQPPDVILIDLGLPGITGYEVARAVRESPIGQGVTLIAVTGYGQTAMRERSKEEGFDAHLVKPVSQALLSNLIGSSAAA